MIGIFDSGVGGLTVVRKMLHIMPEYDFIYLGDTARIPYGTRSKETVIEFSKQNTKFLLDKKCKMIIVACNTATACALPVLQKEYPEVKILGVIVPGAEAACQVTKNHRVGVVATSGTIKSSAYTREIRKINKDIEVLTQSCPLLVPLIEEGFEKHFITRKVIKLYVRKLKDSNIDTLVLGCTHYPIIKKVFEQIMGKRVKVINSGKETAVRLLDYLKNNPELDEKLSKKTKHEYFLTDVTDRFQEIAERFLGERIEIEKVDLE